MRSTSLLMLLLAACPEPTSEKGSDPPVVTECTNFVVGVAPEEVLFSSVFTVTFAEDAAEASIRLEDAEGMEVPSSSAGDGTTVVLTPDAVLEPASDYTLVVDVCDEESRRDIRTSDIGLPMEEPSTLEGKAWSVDLGSGEVVDPPGVDAILSTLISDVGLLLGVASYDDGAATLEMIGALAGADGQDLCTPTLVLPEPADFDNPMMVLSSPSLPIEVAGFSVMIEDLDVTGVIAPDGSAVVDASLQGSIDTRGLVGVVPGTEDGADDSVCELLGGFGVACIACSADGEPYCLSLHVRGLEGTAAAAAIVPRTEDDIAADVDCAE